MSSYSLYRGWNKYNAEKGVTLLRGDYHEPRTPGGKSDLPMSSFNTIVCAVTKDDPRGLSHFTTLAQLKAILREESGWSYFVCSHIPALLDLDHHFQLLTRKRQRTHVLLSSKMEVKRTEFDGALEQAEKLYLPIPSGAAQSSGESPFPSEPDDQCIFVQALLWASRDAQDEPLYSDSLAIQLWHFAMDYHVNPVPDASFRYELTRSERRVISSALSAYSKRFCLDDTKGISAHPYGAVELLTEVEEIWLIELLQLLRKRPELCPWAADMSVEELSAAYHQMKTSLVDEQVVDAALKNLSTLHVPVPFVGALVSLLPGTGVVPPSPGKHESNEPSPPPPSSV